MKDQYIERKKLLKIIIIAIVAIVLAVSVVKYVIYLCTYHQFVSSEMLLFGPAEDGLTNPSFHEEEINPETGMVEQLAEGSVGEYYDKLIITIKGELQTGSFHYILYGDNEKVVFEITLEPGKYYDETYELSNVGGTQNDYFEFAPETKALDEGIYFKFSYQETGFSADFGD